MTDPINTFDPAKTALLIMDYQAGILGRLPEADELLERAAGAIGLARDAGMTIGYVRVAFTDADIAAVPAASMMASRLAAGAGSMHADSPATQVDQAIAPEAGDVVVRKTRVGAFSTTDLDAQLRDRGIDTLLLGGISSSGVVLSTVRDGADRDYRLVVISDLCADPVPGVHEFLTTQIFPRQGEVLTLSEVRSRIGGS